ncbi:MAG: hypothetical protein FWD04_06625 [Conexibacteraceae bacterium]|nr:hypothetical protein [Conexibacteraceae bacterium]
MLRLFAILVALGACAATPAAALALQPRAPTQVTGTLTSDGAFSFIVQTPGRAVGTLNALSAAANRLTAENLPYVWGGGHGQAGIPSIGSRGPGYNGRRRGYDCSGVVAAVLVGAGLWPVGGSVPNDAGLIQYLLRRGLIARGAGVGPEEVTLYDQPGLHVFMNIDGRFFGTSDGAAGGGDAKGGPGWLDDGAPDAQSPVFRRYHIVPAALKSRTNAASTLAFQPGPGLEAVAGYPLGARLRVAYATTAAGTMVAESVTLLGETTVSGTVSAIAPDLSSFTVQTASGATLTLPAAAGSAVAAELTDGQIAAGDSVSVSYVTVAGVMDVVGVTVGGAPGTTTTAPTTTAPTPPPPTGGTGV